jgi:hypothetical protein
MNDRTGVGARDVLARSGPELTEAFGVPTRPRPSYALRAGTSRALVSINGLPRRSSRNYCRAWPTKQRMAHLPRSRLARNQLAKLSRHQSTGAGALDAAMNCITKNANYAAPAATIL